MWNPYQLAVEKDKSRSWLKGLNLLAKFKLYIQKAIDKSSDVNWISGLRKMEAEDVESWLSFL